MKYTVKYTETREYVEEFEAESEQDAMNRMHDRVMSMPSDLAYDDENEPTIPIVHDEITIVKAGE